MTPDHFQMLARYNQAANSLVYDACAGLPDAARKADRKAFFTSIHGTLNHLMVGDGMWMERFEGVPLTVRPLDTILFDDFDDLRAARVEMDARITRYMAGLTAEQLSGTLDWTSVSLGRSFTHALPFVLTHFFNHQTHHRGQVHHMLGEAGAETPVLDLMAVLMD